MAQYKVLQDIEAEDKLLGPLSLRQFIYAAITVALGFVGFRLIITPAWFLGIIFVPPAIFFGLLAAPIGGQQSSEIWLLAKIRFFLKPRKRIWDQSGIKELVTITVPKKIERQLTDGYSPDEVHSRLKVLAATLDTRGWAVKNATPNTYTLHGDNSDRLLNISEQSSPTVYVEPTADMFDPATNPRTQTMDRMITKSTEEHRQTILTNMRTPSSTPAAQAPPAVSLPTPVIDEEAALNMLHKKHDQLNPTKQHMKVLDPLGGHKKSSTPTATSKHVTAQPDPDILNLVENSEDLSVATVAGQAKRIKDQGAGDEVVISLH